MFHCPECGEKIGHLEVVATEQALYTFSKGDSLHKVISKGTIAFVQTLQFTVNQWQCPRCYAALDIADANEANKLLRD